MPAASSVDFRELARRRLPHFLFEYIDGAAGGEGTSRRNAQALEDLALRQRVMRDVARIDPGIELFGNRQSLPIALGPIGLAGMNARRGEIQAARAAEDVGVPFCLSTVSVCPLREVVRETTKPFWFQLYMLRDRGFVRDLLAQATEAGCSALVFTVDMPVAGIRHRDYRSGLAGAPGLRGELRRFAQALAHPYWAWTVGLRGRPHQLGNVAPILGGRGGLEDFFGWIRDNFDPAVTWRDLDFIRESWRGPLIIKGVMDPHDARDAVALGADGIVVSNHGGRQLDGAPATADVLPGIVDAVGSRTVVMVDGGVRSGTDVLRMLALGARCVLLGRAWAYALSAGHGGVVRLLRMIESELRIGMALTGTTSIAALDRNVLSDHG